MWNYFFFMSVVAGENGRKPESSLQKKPNLVQTPDFHLDPNSPGRYDVLDPILHSPQVQS